MRTVLYFLASMMVVASGSLHGAVGAIDGNYQATTVSGANLVALDFSSNLSTSSDGGETFELRQTTNETYDDLASLDSVVIAVGVDGLILRSADSGLTWNLASSPVLFGSLYAVGGRTDGSNPNRWVAVGDDGLDGKIFRSVDDGVSWSEETTIPDLLPEAVIWTGNRWLLAGRDQFFNEGIVYHSVDGVTWSPATMPAGGAQPLLDIAADGNGVVLAVGERGQLLRSTDDGLTFTAFAPEFLGGGDLNTAVVAGNGTFFVGGDEKMILEVNALSVTVLAPATSNAASVNDIIVINDSPVAIGAFVGSEQPPEPLAVDIAFGGSLDLVVSVGPTLSNKSYFIETTDDLNSDSWTLVGGSGLLGNGSVLQFDLPADSLKRFWRVVEF